MGNERTIDKGRSRGQTVIETVLMLIFLLFLFFLIAEFARAWYLKNSLNNAARVGVREAVVTPNLAPIPTTFCHASSGAVLNSICFSPGLSNLTQVTVSITTDVNPPAAPYASRGDTITVHVEQEFETLIPLVNAVMPERAVSVASMRYE
jgi:Flp pilus assembly protein TadG